MPGLKHHKAQQGKNVFYPADIKQKITKYTTRRLRSAIYKHLQVHTFISTDEGKKAINNIQTEPQGHRYTRDSIVKDLLMDDEGLYTEEIDDNLAIYMPNLPRVLIGNKISKRRVKQHIHNKLKENKFISKSECDPIQRALLYMSTHKECDVKAYLKFKNPKCRALPQVFIDNIRNYPHPFDNYNGDRLYFVDASGNPYTIQQLIDMSATNHMKIENCNVEIRPISTSKNI